MQVHISSGFIKLYDSGGMVLVQLHSLPFSPHVQATE